MFATVERDTHPRRKVKVQLRQLGIELGSCGWGSMKESVISNYTNTFCTNIDYENTVETGC